MNDWRPTGIVPVDGADETIEALARIYVGSIASVDESDVVLGEYERSVVLCAKAEVACCLAVGVRPHLMFSGPPLRVEVASGEELRRMPPPDAGDDVPPGSIS